MGRRVEEKFNEGTVVTEYVNKVEPLGEDRKTIFIPEMPTERRTQISCAVLFTFLSSIMEPMEEKFGDEVWEVAKKAIYDFRQKAAPAIMKMMQVDPTDARSLGRMVDTDDDSVGVKGEWVEFGKKRAVKREYFCPAVRAVGKNTKICTELMETMERAYMDAAGAKLKNSIIFQKLIPKGDPYCEVVIELEG